MKKNIKKFRNKYLPPEDKDKDWQKWPELTRKAKHYIFRNNEVQKPTLREKHIANEAKRMLKKLAKALHASMPIITSNPPKMPMYKPGMLTYKNPQMSVRMPWYEVRKPEIIISKESRERILARMKEVSECVANCGVSADRLAKRLREFAEAGRPKDETEGKASGTAIREPKTYAQMVATEGEGVGTPPEVQPGANVMLPMSEDE